MFMFIDVVVDSFTSSNVGRVVWFKLKTVPIQKSYELIVLHSQITFSPVQDIFIFIGTEDVVEMLGFEHLRGVVAPPLRGEVDLVEPVLLLPVRGAQLPASLPHHDDPGPYLFFHCK